MKQIKKTSTDARGNRNVKAFTVTRAADRTTLLLTAMLLVALAVLALVTAASNRNSVANTIAAVTHTSSVGGKAVLSLQETMRTERVTAFPYGFEPEEITRPEGLFLLCVDNRAGTEALSLQLTSGTYGPVYAAPIEKGKSGTDKELSLTPGVYILTEASHPGWICKITITPK